MELVTFADRLTKFSVFLVMLFFMFSVKLGKWGKISDSLSQTLPPTVEPQLKAVTVKLNIWATSGRYTLDLDYLTKIFGKIIIKKVILKSITFAPFGDRSIVLLPSGGLIKSKNAVFKDNVQSLIFFLGGILQNVGNIITVNFHTDQKSPISWVFVSNWEPSTWRTRLIFLFLQKFGRMAKCFVI
jgi:hypothetical protein